MCRAACHVHVRAGVERGLPPPARVHALVHLLERARNRGAGSGRRPCEWATVLWSAAPLFFFRRSECKPRRAREYRAEEKRKSNNRREKWARFESGYETEHRRITVGEILSAVPLTRSAEKCARQRQIQFWITLPMGNPDALTDRVVRIWW